MDLPWVVGHFCSGAVRCLESAHRDCIAGSGRLSLHRSASACLFAAAPDCFRECPPVCRSFGANVKQKKCASPRKVFLFRVEILCKHLEGLAQENDCEIRNHSNSVRLTFHPRVDFVKCSMS